MTLKSGSWLHFLLGKSIFNCLSASKSTTSKRFVGAVGAQWYWAFKKYLEIISFYLTLCKNHKCYIQALTRKGDAQIHGVCSSAKGTLRLLMQAVSLPVSVLCNPGEDFPKFTNFLINTEKPQEWRTSPFRRHLIQNEYLPWGILSPQKFFYTQQDNRAHWIEWKHLFIPFRFPEILNQEIVFFHFSNLIFCLANDQTVKKAVLNKDCTQTLRRGKEKINQ